MGLHKGHTNNPKGRPKGLPNKVTAEVKEILKDLVNAELEQLPQRLEKLEDRERVEVLVKLLPYILPKPRATENSDFIEQPLLESMDEAKPNNEVTIKRIVVR